MYNGLAPVMQTPHGGQLVEISIDSQSARCILHKGASISAILLRCSPESFAMNVDRTRV
jgi:hypothetical protein